MKDGVEVDEQVDVEEQTGSGDELLKTEEVPKQDPIASAIDKLVLRISDIAFSAITFIPKAARWQIDQLKKTSKEIQRNFEVYEGGDDSIKAAALKNIIVLDKNYKRFEKSEIVRTLEIGHFLSLFSAFDAFTGDILTSIYNKKPALFKGINRSMTVSEMLQYENIEDVKSIILQNEIENFRRKSYVEQFESLENRFSINLKKFPKWAEFIECSQRRNLLTHCDGIVSDQYILVCKKEGCKIDPPVNPGEKLGLSPRYLISSCNLIIEVALKLGQTLWRDQFEDEIKLADEHLHSTQYEFLRREQYDLAIMAGDFSYNLPKHSAETLKTISLINYAIALKFKEQKEKTDKLLDSKDWGPLCNDFKLAVAVLKDDFAQAAILMRKIGFVGEFVSEQGYHEWPLFKYFRESSEFLEAYNDIYGHQFIKELKRATDEARAESEEEIAKIQKDLIEEHEVHCDEGGLAVSSGNSISNSA